MHTVLLVFMSETRLPVQNYVKIRVVFTRVTVLSVFTKHCQSHGSDRISVHNCSYISPPLLYSAASFPQALPSQALPFSWSVPERTVKALDRACPTTLTSASP